MFLSGCEFIYYCRNFCFLLAPPHTLFWCFLALPSTWRNAPLLMISMWKRAARAPLDIKRNETEPENGPQGLQNKSHLLTSNQVLQLCSFIVQYSLVVVFLWLIWLLLLCKLRLHIRYVGLKSSQNITLMQHFFYIWLYDAILLNVSTYCIPILNSSCDNLKIINLLNGFQQTDQILL